MYAWSASTALIASTSASPVGRSCSVLGRAGRARSGLAPLFLGWYGRLEGSISSSTLGCTLVCVLNRIG